MSIRWTSRQTSLHGLFSGWSMKKPRLLIAPVHFFLDLVEGVTTPVIQVIFNRSIGGEKNNDRITAIGIIFRRWLDGLSSAVIRLVAYLSIYRGETGTEGRVNDPLFKHFVRH